MRRWALLLALFPLLAMGQGFTKGIPKSGGRRAGALKFLLTGTAQGQLCSGSIAGSKGQTFTYTRAGTKFCRSSSSSVVGLTANHPAIEASGFLGELAHTNLFIRSQEFDNATAWIPQGVGGAAAPVVTANAALAPDGTMTADQVDFPAATTGQSTDIYQELVTNDAIHTVTFWVRGRLASGTLYLLIYDGTFELARAINFTTTWQRFTFTLHINATTSDFVLGFSDAGGWVGLGGPASVYLWQGDLAQNAYARSPVLTTTASATQAADVAHMASTSLPVAAGVVRLNFTPLWSTPPAAGAALIDSRGASATATKGVTVYVDSASKLNFGIGTTTALAQSAALTWTAGTIYTIQAVWGSGTVTLYRNGTQVGQSTSVTMPGSHDQLNLLDGRLGDGTFAADGNLSGLCFDTKTPACAGGP